MLERGRVVEEGTADALLRRGGGFAELFGGAEPRATQPGVAAQAAVPSSTA